MHFPRIMEEIYKLRAKNLKEMKSLALESSWSQHQLYHPQVPPHPLAVPQLPLDHNSPVPCRPVLHRRQQAFRAILASSQQELLPPIPPKELCRKIPTPPTAPTAAQTTKSRKLPSRLPRLKKTVSLRVATAVTEQNSVEEVGDQKKVKKKRESKARQKRETRQARELPALDKLPPLPYPEQALLQAFWMLSSSDGEKKVEALISIRSLAQHHPELLLLRLHDVCLAITREVKNLHSEVSCAAMVTLAHLYAHLRRGMDAEADGTARMLILKAGEASNFIREDAELALGYMVLNVNPTRSMNALISTGLRHSNVAVRKSMAQHLDQLVEVIGLPHLLSGKDLTVRFIQAISCLALDSALEVRTQAQRTLGFLAGHPNLVKIVDRFVPPNDQVTIKNIINKCQYRKLH